MPFQGICKGSNPFKGIIIHITNLILKSLNYKLF